MTETRIARKKLKEMHVAAKISQHLTSSTQNTGAAQDIKNSADDLISSIQNTGAVSPPDHEEHDAGETDAGDNKK